MSNYEHNWYMITGLELKGNVRCQSRADKLIQIERAASYTCCGSCKVAGRWPLRSDGLGQMSPAREKYSYLSTDYNNSPRSRFNGFSCLCRQPWWLHINSFGNTSYNENAIQLINNFTNCIPLTVYWYNGERNAIYKIAIR